MNNQANGTSETTENNKTKLQVMLKKIIAKLRHSKECHECSCTICAICTSISTLSVLSLLCAPYGLALSAAAVFSILILAYHAERAINPSTCLHLIEEVIAKNFTSLSPTVRDALKGVLKCEDTQRIMEEFNLI